MLLDDRFAEFLETLRGQSACNRRNYEQRLRGFLALHGGKPVAGVTAADVNAWHRELHKRKNRKGQPLASATLSGYRQALKALFNHCVEMGDIVRSPAAHLAVGSFTSSRADKLPRDEDVGRVTALAWQWSASMQPQRVRDGLIWLLSLYSGPRLGEIRGLLLADAQAALRRGPDEYGVYRMASTGKTGRVSIRFAGNVAEVLTAWLALRPPSSASECFITTRPDATGDTRALTRSAASHIYESLCAAAGVVPPIFSHALRHRLGDQTARQFGPKVTAILLNHRDWQTAATAIAFYHHPDETDASLAILSGNGYVASAAPDERDELHRLFGVGR